MHRQVYSILQRVIGAMVRYGEDEEVILLCLLF